MMIIGITESVTPLLQQEILRIEQMLIAGVDIFHLRKPGSVLSEIKHWLSYMNPVLKRQISWHIPDYFKELSPVEGLQQSLEFSKVNDVHRIHFPAWWREKIQGLLGMQGYGQLLADYKADHTIDQHWIFSTSCHELKDALLQLQYFDYVFLSPVFDSFSKKEYKANRELLDNLMKMKNETDSILASRESLYRNGSQVKCGQLIALGGINIERLKLVESAGFDGAAMLGSIWSQATLDQHIPYIKKCKYLWN